MKYVSIDIETTGLDPDSHMILEVAAVATAIGGVDKFGNYVYQPRETFRALIVPDDMQKIVVSPFTAKMHERLWTQLGEFEKDNSNERMSWVGQGEKNPRICCRAASIGLNLGTWLCGLPEYQGTTPKITVAGKNAAGFDLPFLRKHGNLGGFLQTRHRVLDVASHYYKECDECLPDLDTCLSRAGIPKRTCHGALDDALLVVELVDKCFEKLLAPF